MARSFQIVEEKVRESDFFLKKLCESERNIFEAQYYISAFTSAARSITFTMQASLKELNDFEDWYKEVQSELKENKMAQYFLLVRNLSQKVGFYPIGGGRLEYISKGEFNTNLFFTPYYPTDISIIPETDVITSTNEYFKVLLKIVQTCYLKFGVWIDPNMRYTEDGIKTLGLSIEDIEEEIGFPKGWTAVANSSDKERIQLIRNHAFNPGIDDILLEYLGQDRYGNST